MDEPPLLLVTEGFVVFFQVLSGAAVFDAVCRGVVLLRVPVRAWYTHGIR